MNMKMRISLSIATVLLSFTHYLYASEETLGELIISTSDQSYQEIYVNAVGTVWGDHNSGYSITNSYDNYSDYNFEFGLDHCESQDAGKPVIGFGLYQITIPVGGQNYSIYIDWRDCDYNNPSYYFNYDMPVIFNPNTHAWTAHGQSVQEGDTMPIWNSANKYTQTQNTSKFQPTDPSGLSISNQGGHPSLT
jgi:hypothetical protein